MTTRFADAALPIRAGKNHAGSGRQAWIDVARATALVLVVFGHTERGLAAGGLLEGAMVDAFDRIVYSFHVPLFFLVSGLLFAPSIGRQPFKASWKERTVRLAQPYLIWSGILLGLLVLAANMANAPVTLNDAMTGLLLLPFQPVSIFWFLYTLLICMTVSALATEYCHATPIKLLLGSCAVHVVYLLWLSDLQAGPGLQFVRFAEHQLYFAIGFFLSPFILTDKARIPAYLRSGRAVAAFAILATLCFLASAVALVGLDQSYHSPVGTLAALSGCAAVLSVCYLLVEIMHRPVPGIVLTISSETLAIFCMHVPFVSSARMVMTHLGIGHPWALLAVGAGAGLIGPLLALRLLDGLGLAGFAGFGDVRRAHRLAGRP